MVILRLNEESLLFTTDNVKHKCYVYQMMQHCAISF